MIQCKLFDGTRNLSSVVKILERIRVIAVLIRNRWVKKYVIRVSQFVSGNSRTIITDFIELTSVKSFLLNESSRLSLLWMMLLLELREMPSEPRSGNDCTTENAAGWPLLVIGFQQFDFCTTAVIRINLTTANIFIVNLSFAKLFDLEAKL